MSVSEQAIWIARVSEPLNRSRDGALAGLTVAVKDNIDVAGFPTTAGCPEFAYEPEASAPCVERLLAAGASIVGKTNMDQFATGLVGTRSPYGALSSVADPNTISGGSSSGSAVAVALGLVDIALGTDTAGSGRVPAALNGIVGLKPTRGLISTAGVVPACASLDCVSIFARSVAEARLALSVMSDPDGRSARFDARGLLHAIGSPRVGIPSAAVIGEVCDEEGARCFADAVEQLGASGATIQEIDFAPFATAAALLYGGPWVAERYAAVGAFIEANPDATFDPIVRKTILGGASVTGPETFAGQYRLAQLVCDCAPVWSGVDVIFVPTAGIAPTHDEVAVDPIGVNSRLGAFTNFVNLMDLCAISLPAGRRASGVPFGVQLIGPAFSDVLICDLGARWERDCTPTVDLAVVGAHLSGQPLNHQLTSRGARLVSATTTTRDYRLYALADTTPPKPGLVHTPGEGAAIEIEVWRMQVGRFGEFVAEVPAPLGIGTVRIAGGNCVKGFICESAGIDGANDITAFGGWRAYQASLH